MRSARIRAIASDGPPAENGTMMVMGRDGKFWAAATLLNANTAIAARMNFRITCSIKSRKYLPHPEELAKQASRRMCSAGLAAILRDAAKRPLLRNKRKR